MLARLLGASLLACLVPCASAFCPPGPSLAPGRRLGGLGGRLPCVGAGISAGRTPHTAGGVRGRNLAPRMVDGYSGTVVDKVDNWLRGQTIGALVSKVELKNLLRELDGDEDFWRSQKPKFDSLWKNVDAHLRQESRPLSSILREGMTKQIAAKIETAQVDKDIVKAFMRTRAVETMAGAILYTGIFEFIQRADFVGNAVNRLPVIGPVRQQFNNALKDVLDQTLGTQIKDFLGTNSRPAVEQMIAFILAEENKSAFGKSAKRVAEYLFSKPVNSLLPSMETSQELRDEYAGTISDEEDLLDTFFDELGDKELGEFLPDIPPTAKKGLLKIWQKFLDSENGLDFSESSRPRSSRQRDLE